MIPPRTFTHGSYTLDYMGPNEWAEFQEYAHGLGVNLTDGNGLLDFATTPLGVRWIVWRAARRNQPELQIEQAALIGETFKGMQKLVQRIVDPTQAEEKQASPKLSA